MQQKDKKKLQTENNSPNSKNANKTGTVKTSDNENKLEVVITSNKSLLEILEKPSRVWKIVGALIVLVFTIFLALAFVTISIKRIYPYNDIKVNALGATTMQKEDIEVIYWLFNTADLWANSGIKVNKGDILTIRASGRFSTAIHHVVKNAEDNEELRYPWVGTDGESTVSFRGKYRIFPNNNKNSVLMQVVPENISTENLSALDIDQIRSRARDQYLRFDYVNYKNEREIDDAKQRYYYIGKERNDLRINSNGILHFAVNDVPLTDSVLKSMIEENINYVLEKLMSKKYTIDENNKPQDRKNFFKALKEYKNKRLENWKQDSINFYEISNIRAYQFKYDEYILGKDSTKFRSLKQSAFFNKMWKIYNEFDERTLQVGSRPDIDAQKNKTFYSNEMWYYLENHYYNAWYDDNIGSFLIVIERKTHN